MDWFVVMTSQFFYLARKNKRGCTHFFEYIPSFFVIRSLRTHARGGAQRGEQSGDDACNYLQDCFPTFFLHDSTRF
jgi:hypothetical protein